MATAKSAVLTPDVWRERYLSRYPLATDNLDVGAWRERRERALRRQYVETSPRAVVAAVVIDVDRPDAVLRAFERPSDHPVPSWVVEGPTGHGHVGWWLTAPVCRTDAGRVDPLRYLARVTEGLRRSLDGDPAYAGLLTRNPLADGAGVVWGTDATYSLGELRTTAMPRALPRRPDRASGSNGAVGIWLFRLRLRGVSGAASLSGVLAARGGQSATRPGTISGIAKGSFSESPWSRT